MVKENRKRQRNRSRKRKPEVEVLSKKKRNYGWILLIAFGMALMGVIVGQVADSKIAVTMGIIGFIIGGIGGVGILFGDTLPGRKGTEQASQNYRGGNKMPDID